MERKGEFGRDIPAGNVYSINYHFSGDAPFEYTHGVIKGAWIRKSIPWLKKEGYGEYLVNRPKMSFNGTLYLWMFGILMAVFRKINFKWKP